MGRLLTIAVRLRVPAAVALAAASGVCLYMGMYEAGAWLGQGAAGLGLADGPAIAAGVRRMLEAVRPAKALEASAVEGESK